MEFFKLCKDERVKKPFFSVQWVDETGEEYDLRSSDWESLKKAADSVMQKNAKIEF